MSSFRQEFKHKGSGDTYLVWCIDDFYGKHRYGYEVLSGPNVAQFNNRVLTEDEFETQFEEIKG